MSLVPSLLHAIVNVDGEAMVMHAGDKPYVVSPTGQVELASRGLTLEAVNGIVGQLLPIEIQNALDEFGAIQYELPAATEFAGEHFTVVAARGGDDLWVEIRRRRVADDDYVPEELFSHASARSVASAPAPPATESAPTLITPQTAAASGPSVGRAAEAVAAVPPQAAFAVPPPSVAPHVTLSAAPIARSGDESVQIDDDLALPDAAHLWPAVASRDVMTAQANAPNPTLVPDEDFASIDVGDIIATLSSRAAESAASAVDATPIEVAAPDVPPAAAPAPAFVVAAIGQEQDAAPALQGVADAAPEPQADTPALFEEAVTEDALQEPVAFVPESVLRDTAQSLSGEAAGARETAPPPPPEPAAAQETAPPRTERSEGRNPARPPRIEPIATREAARSTSAPLMPSIEPESSSSNDAPASELASPAVAELTREVPPQPAVVLPISRSPIRGEAPPPLVPDPTLSGLERLLRLSSARGASTLYLSSESQPSVRVDGELQVLDAEPSHTSRDVESLLLTLMPERSHEALRTGALTEWICDIEGVGRVRCMSFRDHRGPGGVFRLMPTRSASVDQLGLPKSVQSLAMEPEGLILVAGPRSSGKRTLMAAFVDLINRTRRDHIITIEREINIVHERGSSFISQREVRGNDDELLAAARGALREDPDVLVIEDLRTGQLMDVALEAAASGHLVVGGFSAHTAGGAIDRIIDLYPPESRRQVQLALADSLRGVIVQVLLRKIGGGRLAARELLLNTPAVSSVIAEGKTSQLPMAIEGGRRYGMMPMNDALAGLVQSGAVEARDAYRQSTDRPGLLAALARQGVDTSFAERLA